jgi:hypothetical protein
MRSFVVCLCAGLVLSLVHVSSAGPPGGGQGGKGLGGPGGQKGPPGQGVLKDNTEMVARLDRAKSC